MFTRTRSAAIHGMDVREIDVEVILNEKAASAEMRLTTVLVGLPDAAVRESRERILSAMRLCGYAIPYGQMTINLAPADLRKSGTAFDLPIALCILGCQNVLPGAALARVMVVGELALSGEVRPVCGVLSMAMYAKEAGIETMLVPAENAREAAMAGGVNVYAIHTLSEAVEFIKVPSGFSPMHVDLQALYQESSHSDVPDFLDVKGQESTKRAMTVAAAGNHNMLMIGNPGCGKTMLAKRLPGILPMLTIEEALEVTKIHSIAGVLDPRKGLVVERPFRSPHHTISDAGLVGGTTTPRPGELSLAHNGVLFLDELPEFRRSTLEVMRQPLESGEVTISRAAGTYVFPAKVMLVAAMNPCPCGYYGSPVRRCSCSPLSRQAYRSRLSGPLLDRIDILVEVALVTHEQMSRRRAGESSASMREKVLRVREIQARRFAGTPIRYNSEIYGKYLEQFCALTPECETMLQRVVEELHLSARAYDRILRVSRTLADLDNAEAILPQHIQEASNYRCTDRQEW